MVSTTAEYRLLVLLVCALQLASTAKDDDMSPPRAQTSDGVIQGYKSRTSRCEKIYNFEGIQYGKPPVGDLRFRPPQPVDPWDGVKMATKAGPIPFAPPIEPRMSEDCLYLNVYTPEKPDPDNMLPVMVFIPGGAFTLGHGSRSLYGPDYLVPQGVILVTMNYRLGPLGFLSFYEHDASGNNGLKDQLLALKWVKKHIESFGGDPDNITLFGESAGSVSVQYQMLSPASRGLFNRAIGESGSTFARWAYARNARKAAFLLAKKCGCNTSDYKKALDHLRRTTVEMLTENALTLFEEVEGAIWSVEKILRFVFVPGPEPENATEPFLTKYPYQAIADGDMLDIPFITGAMDSEMIFTLPSADFVPPSFDDIEFYQELLPRELNLELGSEKVLAAATAVRELYFPDGPTQRGYIDCTGDLAIIYGMYKTAGILAKKNSNKVYLFLFTGSRNDSSMKTSLGLLSVNGTSHSDELDHIFTNDELPEIQNGTDTAKIRDNIVRLWTDFAKNGEFDEDEWPPVQTSTGDGLPYLHIGKTLKIGDAFLKERMELWDSIFKSLTS